MLLEGLQISGGQANFLQLPTHVLGQPRISWLTDFREIPRGAEIREIRGAEIRAGNSGNSGKFCARARRKFREKSGPPKWLTE